MAHKFRFLTIAMVIAIGITSWNGMITAFVHMTRTYDNAFDEHHMASFTILTANPGGSGDDAWIDFDNLTDMLNTYKLTEPRMRNFELRIVYDTIFQIRGERQNGRIVASSTVDSEGNFREQPDVNGYRLLSQEETEWTDKSGSYFTETSRYQNVCLIDAHLAQYWKLEPQEFISVGDDNTPCEVLGIVGSPEYLINMGSYADIFPSPRRFGVVFLPLRTAQKILGVSDRVNEISVLLDSNLTQKERKIIASDLRDYLEDQGLKLSDPVDLDNQVAYWLLRIDIEEAREFGIFLPAIVLVMAIGGLYVLLGRMVVAERKDIGVAQALGYSRNSIILQYFGISMIISGVGTAIGTLLGLWFLNYFSPLYVEMLTIPFNPKTTLEWPIIGIGIILGILTGAIGGYFPVKGAIQPLPAESLRFDPSLHITAGKIPLTERILNRIGIKFRVTGYKLPMRNFFRSKRRTFSSIFAIIVSVSLISMALGMIESMDYALTFQYQVAEDWDLRIDYSEIPINTSQIAASLKEEINEITNVTYHLISGATVFSNNSIKSKQVQLIGMNESDGYLGHKFDFEAGKWDSNGVVLSVPVADSLKVTVNDNVYLELPVLTKLVSTAPLRAHFEMVNVSFKITGIIDEFNGLVAYVGLQRLASVSKFPGEPCNSILVELKNPTPEMIEQVRDEIYSKFSYNVRNIFTRIEERSDLLDLLDLIYGIMDIVIIFAVALSAAIVYNTIYISLIEQQRELATLLTMGTPSSKLVRNVTLENLLVTLIGTGLGLVAGWILLWFFMSVILDMEFFRIKLFISIDTMLKAFIFTLIGVLIAQFFPLRRTLNLNLAEATKERVV